MGRRLRRSSSMQRLRTTRCSQGLSSIGRRSSRSARCARRNASCTTPSGSPPWPRRARRRWRAGAAGGAAQRLERVLAPARKSETRCSSERSFSVAGPTNRRLVRGMLVNGRSTALVTDLLLFRVPMDYVSRALDAVADWRAAAGPAPGHPASDTRPGALRGRVGRVLGADGRQLSLPSPALRRADAQAAAPDGDRRLHRRAARQRQQPRARRRAGHERARGRGHEGSRRRCSASPRTRSAT